MAWLGVPAEPKHPPTSIASVDRENIAQGRKTLFFVEQSNTRDIRSRLENLVAEEAHLVSSRTLWETSNCASVSCPYRICPPAKHKAWIKINPFLAYRNPVEEYILRRMG